MLSDATSADEQHSPTNNDTSEAPATTSSSSSSTTTSTTSGTANYDALNEIDVDLSKICDRKHDPSDNGSFLYRYNESLTLEWLSAKVLHVANALTSVDSSVLSTKARAATYNVGAVVLTADDRKRMAVEFITTYLDSQLAEKLCTATGYVVLVEGMHCNAPCVCVRNSVVLDNTSNKTSERQYQSAMNPVSVMKRNRSSDHLTTPSPKV
jgi:hypothetical protein